MVLRKEDNVLGGSKYECGFCRGSRDVNHRRYAAIHQEGSVFTGMEMGSKENEGTGSNTKKMKAELLHPQMQL